MNNFKIIFQIIFILKFVIVFGQKNTTENRSNNLKPLPAFITNNHIQKFKKWENDFNFKIDINDTDGREKFLNFVETFNKMEKHNKKFRNRQISFSLRLNSHSLLSFQEKRARMNGLLNVKNDPVLKLESRVERPVAESFPKAPNSLDYRKLGFVTQVQDQGLSCASCFAFAGVASIEGAVFKKYGRLVKLSEQNIIDCNFYQETGNYGCDGGWMSGMFEYIIGNNGTEAASTYPLGDVQYPCKFNSTRTSTFLKSYGYINGDEEVLKRALNSIGPLAIGINGGIDSFYDYGFGIYDDSNCNDNINHAVALIGYGTDNSFSPPKDYWIIKNSWGTNWGEGGFMRIVRGKNMCGLKNYVLYPIL